MAHYTVTVHAVTAVDGPRTAPTAAVGTRRPVRAGSPHEAAQLVLADLCLSQEMVGIWTVRRRGPLGIARRWTGRFGTGTGGDDGLAGVREPRRPLPPTGTAAAALDPPAA
jgi:hypothetical protein